MVRIITQIMLGLMLIFGTVTILPKGIFYFKLKNRGKGILYIFLGLLCAFFALSAFQYAYTLFMEIY